MIEQPASLQPFALSLSKGVFRGMCFDRLSTNGLMVLALMLAAPASADSPLPQSPLAYTQLPDPAQEAKAKALMETLRCVVCQGQSIADSDADMAASMRALVRTRIQAGESPASIRAWLIDRYGSYVTFDPPLTGLTWPLWLAPLALIAAGVWLARGSFRKRRPRAGG